MIERIVVTWEKPGYCDHPYGSQEAVLDSVKDKQHWLRLVKMVQMQYQTALDRVDRLKKKQRQLDHVYTSKQRRKHYHEALYEPRVKAQLNRLSMNLMAHALKSV